MQMALHNEMGKYFSRHNAGRRLDRRQSAAVSEGPPRGCCRIGLVAIMGLVVDIRGERAREKFLT